MQDIPSRDQALEIAVVLKNNEKVDYCGNLGYSLGKHAQASGSLSKVTTGDIGGGLIADTEL